MIAVDTPEDLARVEAFALIAWVAGQRRVPKADRLTWADLPVAARFTLMVRAAQALGYAI